MATTMTTPAIVPVLIFSRGIETVEWLCRAFGFTRTLVVDDGGTVVHHAELTLGRAMIMGGSERSDPDSEFQRLAHPPGQAMLYVAIEEDVAAHCERARAAGAEIVIGPASKAYGGTDYTARDPDGNLWTFGSYVPEVTV